MTSSYLNLNSRRNSITVNSDRDEPQTPIRNQSSTDSSIDGQNDEDHPANGFNSPANKPRLVGLSQPFFTTSPPLETPKQQLAAIERVAAEATRSGGKIRVLVAEDNIGLYSSLLQDPI